MSEANATRDDDYYPFRWKVADFFEDLFVLHRTAVVGVLALVGLGFLLLGFLVLGWGSTETETVTGADARTATEGGNIEPTDNAVTDTDDEDAESTASTSSTSTSTSTSSTTTSTTTTTTAPVSARAIDDPAQIEATEQGRVIVLGPQSITLAGGLPSDEAADEVLSLAESYFPNLTVDDQQVIHNSFADSDNTRLRLSAADLFGYNSDNLNATYLPVIDQLAAAIAADDSLSATVEGHTDNTGPSDGNQRLSEGRAASAAQRLINQGVPAERVTSVGMGEDIPVETNTTEAGRLANRRVEFVVG